MDEARTRVGDGPLLVTASRQTGGRGRTGRTWVSADRAVATSLAMRLSWPVESLAVVSLVAGLAAAATFEVRLKWPNDLVRDGSKVGGLLVEFDDGLIVIGMGVNLYWPAPMEGAGALFTEDPGDDAARSLAVRWALEMVVRLELGPHDWGRGEYEQLCTTLGCDITWEPDGSGRAIGVDERGGLIVETPGGTVTLDSGEVSHVRKADS
jgi:BirA family transcriptional regulator, biotin operon repressor / biotin---[acetyl-CoA-carboxylase] ligase